MAEKPIQEQFGDAIIDAVRRFALADIETVADLEKGHFSHISDRGLKRMLAETIYGTRWLYKLGLALLVKDDEQLAHVRAQVIDYASACEGLLYDCLHHALSRKLMRGKGYKFEDAVRLVKPLTWTADISKTLGRRSFLWRIEVAREEKVIPSALADRLHILRRQRNTVHAHSRTHRAFLGTSRTAYKDFCDTAEQTKKWKAANP